MVHERIDRGRRRLLETAALTLAGSRLLGALEVAPANAGDSRELTAIRAATQWVNSPGLSASSMQGKVVLVQFCTYTCINWLRTLPYIRAWAHKYRDGLVVIGAHTPEFEFEHDGNNVRRSVQRLRIDYPIVIDSDYSIWRAFRNRYWPGLYVIDVGGRIRHQHFGEGGYQETELAIQRLLAPVISSERFVVVKGEGAEAAADWPNLRSTETYLGPRWIELPAQRPSWPFSGAWTIGRQAAILSKASGRISYRFHARDLHLVMGPPRAHTPIRFRVSLDGQPPGRDHGIDIDERGNGLAVDQRLYQLIRQQGPINDRRFEIEFLDAGVEAFSLTFG